jgi:hypothetical protein
MTLGIAWLVTAELAVRRSQLKKAAVILNAVKDLRLFFASQPTRLQANYDAIDA